MLVGARNVQRAVGDGVERQRSSSTASPHTHSCCRIVPPVRLPNTFLPLPPPRCLFPAAALSSSRRTFLVAAALLQLPRAALESHQPRRQRSSPAPHIPSHHARVLYTPATHSRRCTYTVRIRELERGLPRISNSHEAWRAKNA